MKGDGLWAVVIYLTRPIFFLCSRLSTRRLEVFELATSSPSQPRLYPSNFLIALSCSD